MTVHNDGMQLDGLGEAHRRLLLTLLQHGPMRRRELAERLQLSPGSITRLTGPLEDQGLVLATAEQVNATGRPGHRVEAVLPRDTIVGVSLSGDALRVVRTDLRGQIQDDVDAALTTHDPDAVADEIAALTLSVADGTTVGLGVGLGGIVHSGREVVRAPFLEWERVPLVDLLTRRLGWPCVLTNDIAAVALAEAWFGVGREAGSFLTLTYGTGVGGAAVVRGVVQDAEAHGVGLLGHLRVPRPDGTVIRVNDGLTDAHLLARARSFGSDAASADEVEAGVDEAAIRAAEEFAWSAGSLAATGAAFLVPEAIVVLGERAGLIARHRTAFDAGVASVRESVAPPLAVTVRQHSRTVWAHGAAVTALVDYVTQDSPGRRRTRRSPA